MATTTAAEGGRRMSAGPGVVEASCDEHPDGCPEAGPGGAFYVSVRSGDRAGCLAGPYATHPEALAVVDLVRAMAEQADPRAVFYGFGTCQAPDTARPFFGLVRRMEPQ